MSKTIWKYPLVLEDAQVIHLPECAEILAVQVQMTVDMRPTVGIHRQGIYGQDLMLWALVDSDKPKMPRKINIYGTGHRIENTNQKYLGTVQFSNGQLVFHVFEETNG